MKDKVIHRKIELKNYIQNNEPETMVREVQVPSRLTWTCRLPTCAPSKEALQEALRPVQKLTEGQKVP